MSPCRAVVLNKEERRGKEGEGTISRHMGRSFLNDEEGWGKEGGGPVHWHVDRS